MATGRLLMLALVALPLLALNIVGTRLPGPALVLVALGLALGIAAGLWPRARSRRAAFLAAYVRDDSPLQRWLAGGLLLRAWQGLLAIPLALVLMVGVIRLSQNSIWTLLLVSLPALAALHSLAGRLLRRHVAPVFLPELSWRLALAVAFLLLWLLLGLAALQQAYPDFSELPLATALWHEASRQQAHSAALHWLMQAAAMKDALVWWLGQQMLPGVGDKLLRAGGWLVLLASSGVFVLAFLLLVAGALAQAPVVTGATGASHRRLGTLALIVAVVTVVLVADQRSALRSAWQPSPWVMLGLQGAHYQVPQSQARSLVGLAVSQVREGEQAARAQVAQQLHQSLDQIFARLAQQLPVFADWYYSLGGEYTRLSMRLLEHTSLVEGDHLARKAQALIFDAAGFSDQLAKVQGQLEDELAQQALATQATWLAELAARLASAQRAPGPPPDNTQVISLDGVLTALGDNGHAAFTQRMVVASGAASATAGAALANAFARRAAARSSAALAARGVAKGARGAAGAGAGAALCAPSGPGALACAAIGGTVAWLATDLALLKADEYLNRDELIADLQIELAAERQRLEDALMQEMDAIIAQQYQGMQQEITRTFRPLGH
ncbi:hypothetical protein [Alcanivorax quisquiliarum]|uniref:Uncharacterized protein n=1 Tax=Alcanivorax quisquiliarum TaxID=2933565 RepID=A0ABT0E9X4_9GAMM|nr:hypothetical protein [Alcanivorax quisquiliarum]MCK0538626.1 hypothetical protein [Alcanivorax quisquiliarum]